MRLLVCVTVFTFATITGAAMAQSPPPAGVPPGSAPPDWQKLCAPDVQKLCLEENKQGKVLECLEAKEEQLSVACKEPFFGFLWKYKIAQVCKEDFDKHCAPPLPEGMTRSQCVKKHEKDLSEPCRKALAQGSRRRKAEAQAAAKPEGAAEKAPAKDPPPSKPSPRTRKK